MPLVKVVLSVPRPYSDPIDDTARIMIRMGATNMAAWTVPVMASGITNTARKVSLASVPTQLSARNLSMSARKFCRSSSGSWLIFAGMRPFTRSIHDTDTSTTSPSTSVDCPREEEPPEKTCCSVSLWYAL